jgi:hypothetical protein
MKKCNYCGRDSEDKAVTCSGCGNELAALSETETDTELRDPALAPVVVATFSSLQEASVLVGRLESAGIEAFVPEEYSEQVFSAVIPLAHLTVRVAVKDYEAATAILAEGTETQPGVSSPGASEGEGQTGLGDRAAGQSDAETGGLQGRLCVSCKTRIPYEAAFCPKCGWAQPRSC